MYPRTVTDKIVEYWALGFSAEETRKVFKKDGVSICIDTIYKHRHSLSAKNLIDELLRRQERAIFKADTDNPELAMKYRDSLLRILLPAHIEQKIEGNVQMEPALGFEADPDLKRLLMESAERQREEKRLADEKRALDEKHSAS